LGSAIADTPVAGANAFLFNLPMSRKIVLDCDPGIDDAVALTMALFDPRLEVLAVTATAGNVDAEQATRNVQAVIERLDPPRLPRIGAASPHSEGPALDARHLHGADGLGNAGFEVAQLHQRHPSEKLLADVIRAHPEQVTVLTLGPLTNMAHALQRDPSLAEQIDQIIMMGGTYQGIGNVTAAAEFNIYCDPVSAREVFASATTKTLVPLEVTREIPFSLALLDELPDDSTRVGDFLHRILPFAFRSFHQHLGQETIFLHDAIALVAALNPELFHTEPMYGDVETAGKLTAGATVFDRRSAPAHRPNMEVAVLSDTAAVHDCVVRGLRNAAQQSPPS